MADVRPLLSLTIPTYNRSRFLAELLECVLPQVIGENRVEVIVSDNASPDDTEAVVRGFVAHGLELRYLRNEVNVGADANFLQCLNQARGKYVWVMGDDDLMAPKAIEQLLTLMERDEYDLVYLSSVGFSGEQRPTVLRDPFGRFAELITDGEFFMEKVSSMITLVSANIVNKDRLLSTPHPPIESLQNTMLLQLGWILPLVRTRCRILYVWERMLFHRAFNSGGWGLCEVFGVRLNAIAYRYFATEPKLAANLMKGVLSMWLPDHIMQLRREILRSMDGEDFSRKLAPLFAGNWRYWVFVYPTANLPLPFAIPVQRVNRLVMKVLRSLHLIGHYVLHRDRLLTP